MRENLKIDLVLLITDDNNSRELSPALWAAFKEVEQFYNYGKKRANFRLLSFSDSVTERSGRSLTSQLRSFLFRGSASENVAKNESDVSVEQVFLGPPESEKLKDVSGMHSRTVDSHKIVEMVQDMIGETEVRPRIIVIDKELTPPENWRYVIWTNHVISTVPTDPLYWGIENPQRISVIKHRVRTACLSNVGSLLGLGRCYNDDCFLYRNVDSTVRLDWMVKLGPEHKVSELENRGFGAESGDPWAIQPIVENPEPRMWSQ